MRAGRLVSLLLVALLVVPAGWAQLGGSTPPQGHAVSFHLQPYNDTLFASVTAAYRVQFDDNGDLWYSTEAGVVHLLLKQGTRELYTHEEGLPSSLALGLAVQGNDVYVGTDLGLAVIDRTQGKVVRVLHSWDSGLVDDIVHELALDGSDLWVGTHFGGVQLYDPVANQTLLTKNTSTTADFAKPVRRILPTPTTVWVGTDGDGVWRYDRASQNWSVLLKADGLPSNSVLAFATQGDATFIGTDAGLAEWQGGRIVRKWNATTDGMPSDTVYALQFVPRADGTGSDLYAATSSGLWELNVDTGANATLAQDWGLMGSNIFDETYNDTYGWAFGTTLGVSLADTTGWRYFSTGPTNAPSPGPLGYQFTAADAADGLVWVGNEQGASAFAPAAGPDGLGRWYDLGEWQAYPGGVINHITRYGNTTWFATSTEAVGYDTDANQWIERKVTGSRNVVYGLDAGQGELWIGLFGDGLIMENLTTGVSKAWTTQSTPLTDPIPDPYVTDVRIDGNTVWLGASAGVIKMDRITGKFDATYTTADGIPGSGVVFRVLPDGPVTYVGTKDGGVATLDDATGKVTRVWNASTTPGFPSAEVRDLYREGGHLWVGTKGGLVRINLTDGTARTWNQTNSKLVQEYVSGVTSQDGILYLATASGVARMDIATEQFLPMRDGPGAQYGATNASFQAPITVRINSPRDGTGVTGLVDVQGEASRLGGSIDRVEVRIGDGPWQNATGTDAWHLLWDTNGSASGQPVTIAARAVSGNATSREVDILVTPVAFPKVPLAIEFQPPATLSAGRPFVVQAKVSGDEPLSATLYYELPSRGAFDKAAMTRVGNVFTATIPGRSVVQGNISYYLEADSGLLSTSAPQDPSRPYVLAVGPPARVAVAIEAPGSLVAPAGEVTRFVLNVTNVGTDPATYQIASSGLRASWVSVPSDALSLQPGETAQVNATIDVPIRAFADNTTLRFVVDDVKGEAQSADASVPVQILASPDAPSGPTATGGPTPARSPAPAVPLALGVVALAALATRRRRP